jgi:hypothetical protein
LLGYVGGPADAADIEKHLADAWNAHNTTNLGSMIAADLQLEGPSRLG